MDDQDFHDKMLKAYKEQKQVSPKEARPKNVDFEEWRNRYAISVKLPPDLYRSFYSYCKEHELSASRALKFLLLTHPFLKNNA